MASAPMENKIIEILNESLKIADNNKEFVLNYDSYAEIDYLNLMSKSELEELKTKEESIDLDFNTSDLISKEETKKKLVIGGMGENKKTAKIIEKAKEEDINILEILNYSLKIKKPIKKTRPKYIKNIWDKIKEKIAIPDIITLENGRCECLNGQSHPENPSCQYNEFDDILFCHKCQTTMDVIQVYAISNNLERSEAIKEIVKQYKIEFGNYDKNYIETEEKIGKLFEDFCNECEKNLLNSEYYDFIKNKRDFTDNIMKSFKIGLFDDSIKEYIDNAYPNKLLQNAGFKDYSKNDKEKRGKLFWKFGKRFVYPYLDQNNNPKYFIYRLIDSEPDFNKNAKYIKQMKTEYIKEIPFGLNTIKKQKDLLIITEGITDSMSLAQLKYSTLSPITTRIKKSDIEKMVNYIKRYDKVLVINDNEEFSKENSGLEGSIDTLKVLIKHSINCFIGIIPNPKKLEKIDLNDYLRPQKEALKKLDIIIEKSIKGIDFLIDNINEQSNQDDIIEILEILPENDFITQEDVFKKLAKKRKLTLGNIRKIYKQYKESEFLKEQKKKKKEQDEELNDFYDLRDNIIEQNYKKNTDIITIRENDEICRRSNGVYKRKQKSFVETQISELLEQSEIPYMVYKSETIIKLIKNQTYRTIKEFDNNPELLNLKNGVLNLKNGEFREYETNDLFFIQIPIEYNPNAECPKIDKFLSEIFNKEDIPFILEFIGLCLTPEMKFQKALMMYGNGNNGKTTFLNLLVNLIGEMNKSSVPLSQLNQSFEGAKLEKKLINVVSDLDSTKMSIRFFKLYVGNEWSITINRKFKEPYDTRPTAKLLYSCNAFFPQIPQDTDKGFFRKWTLIECPNEFDNRENLDILDSLITKQELSGFLNKVIKGLYRLLKRGNFETKYNNWINVRKIWTEKANPFNNFIESEAMEIGKYIDAIHDPNNQFWETKQYTLKRYNEYLEEKLNTPPIQQSLLTRTINNNAKFSLALRKIKGKQQEVYTGFQLQEKEKILKSSDNIQKKLI